MASVPQRIVSLVPSQTELLFELGLAGCIAGITKFCIHPAEQCKHKPRIGGTKNINFEKIDRLQPDLILANKEENYKEGIERLQQNYKVWVSDIYTLEDALQMIRQVGVLTGTTEKAAGIAEKIEAGFGKLQQGTRKKVAYLIWQHPYMVAGSHTFIDDMLNRCGFENVFSGQSRYPEVTADMLAAAQAEYIFLSSEPYPFKEKHISAFRQISPQSNILIVDGEMFSWYGSRLILSVEYFRRLIKELK